MSGGYVKLFNALLDDTGLSDRALRLWAQVRRRHGEGNAMTRGCWQSGAGLDATMKPSSRRRRAGSSARHDATGTPWRHKMAQRELVERGLLVVRRMGPGRPAFRWALSPDPLDGALELNALHEAGVIGDQLYQATEARRAAYRPCEGHSSAHLVGGPPTGKQIPAVEPRSRARAFRGKSVDQLKRERAA